MMRHILAAIVAILGLGLIAGILLNEPLPEGEPGPIAEELADKMLVALNENAYEELSLITWAYPGGHHYVWEKQKDRVMVTWDDYQVDLNLQTKTGDVWVNGEQVIDETAENLRQKAWEYFINDSFWLVAPYKVKDPGTTRAYIETDDGPGLLVTYTSGGVTPGDTYLWVLDEQTHLPKYWKMWVKIIPIGGLKFTWEDWDSYGGALLATYHEGIKDIEIKQLSAR